MGMGSPAMNEERVTAWAVELQTVHHRLEDTLRRARTATAGAALAGDLLAHCYTFCAALTDHHQREDAGLFERLLADDPELTPVIEELKADHVVLAALIADFEATLEAHTATDQASRERFDSHLNALHARMSAHFAAEERRLDNALDRLRTTRAEAIELVGTGRPPETHRTSRRREHR